MTNFLKTFKTFLKTLENISVLFRLTESDDIENLSLSSILARLTPALETSNSSVNSASGEGLTLLPPLVTA